MKMLRPSEALRKCWSVQGYCLLGLINKDNPIHCMLQFIKSTHLTEYFVMCGPYWISQEAASRVC